MTTVNEVHEAILARWQANLPAAVQVTGFAGEKLVPPASGAWARLTVQGAGGAGEQTMGPAGARRFTRRSRLFIQLYDDADKGTQTLDGLVKDALDIFESRSFDGLRFFPASTPRYSEDGRWTQALVEVPFDYQEIK